MVSGRRSLKDSRWSLLLSMWRRSVALVLLTSLTLSAQAQESGQGASSSSASAPGTTPVLNNPTASASQSPAAATNVSGATTSSGAVPTSTAVPVVDLGSATVPFLYAQPSAQATATASGATRASRRPITGPAFKGCQASKFTRYAQPESLLNVSAVWSQFDTDLSATYQGIDPPSYGTLRMVSLAAVDKQSFAFSSASGFISAIQVQSEILTVPIFSNTTFVCDRLFPTQTDSQNPGVAGTCQYGPGQVAFGVDIPLNQSYEATTLWTTITLVDPTSPALTLACIEVPVTPYNADRWYWRVVLWIPIASAIAFFVLASIAALTTAVTSRIRAFKHRAREGGAPTFIKDKLSPTLISSLSGQGAVMSPALLRFVTPGCWDIIHHLQFVAGVAMLALRWPDFAYLFFKQAAWSTLVGNVTLVQNSTIDALETGARLPAGDVGTQMGVRESPLYLDPAMPNQLLDMGNVHTGIEAFARIVGLRASELFGTCLAIWLIIVAALCGISVVAWLTDLIGELWAKRQNDDGLVGLQPASRRSSEDVGRSGSLHAEGELKAGLVVDEDGNMRETKRSGYAFLGVLPGFRPGGRIHTGLSFHLKVLHGNLVRALALFHFPITIFSVYQFARASSHSTTSVALAALAFAILSILAPIYLIVRIARTETSKLYDDIDTLVALGPVYNTYSPGSQLFFIVSYAHSLILGIVIGAAQQSGSAQAILFVVLELLAGLAVGLWLPWPEGAWMGPVSFATSVIRIITAILAVLLTPVVNFGRQATGWLTYVVLLMQGIFFAMMLFAIAAKILEALIRLVWRVPFDDRVSPRTAGLGGAIRRIRRRKYKTLQLRRKEKNVREKGHRSDDSSVRSPIIVQGSGPAGRSPASAGAIPLTHSRQGSYASYLDSRLFANAAQGSPAGTASRPSPGARSPDLIGSANPYSVYYRTAPDDDDHIMAALPPQSPGWSAPTSAALTPIGAIDAARSGGTPINSDAASSPAPAGFVRVGGGKATEANPYSTLPSSSRPQLPHSTKSRRSLQAHVALWGEEPGAMATDPRNAVYADEEEDRRRQAAATLSSTGAAAAASSAARGQPAPKQAGKRPRVDFPMWNRQQNESAAPGESEDWSDEETTWETSAAARGRGPWAGVAMMSALLRRLGGAKEVNADGTLSSSGTESIPPAPNSGKSFQVVRAPRLGGGGGSGPRTPVEQATSSRPVAQGQSSSVEPDSTALAAAAAAAAQANVPPSAQREWRESTLETSPKAKRKSLASMKELKHDEALAQARLGILGADMERASSAGHSDEEENADDAFWLAGPARTGGEGVVQSSDSPPGSAAKRAQRSSSSSGDTSLGQKAPTSARFVQVLQPDGTSSTRSGRVSDAPPHLEFNF